MFSIVTPRKGARRASVVTAGSGPALLAAADRNRKSLTMQNQGSVTVYLGGPAVASSGADRGYALFAGATLTDNASDDAWYALAASDTAIVHVIAVS